MKNKNKNLMSPISEGLKRIEEIKNKITSYREPEFAKAQVYEIWDNIFEPKE